MKNKMKGIPIKNIKQLEKKDKYIIAFNYVGIFPNWSIEYDNEIHTFEYDNYDGAEVMRDQLHENNKEKDRLLYYANIELIFPKD